MTDDRHVQEDLAERRHDETIQHSRAVKANVLEGLAALDRELQRVRKEAEKLPNDAPTHRRFWPWSLMLYFSA